MNRESTTEALPLAGYQVFFNTDVDRIAPATRRISSEHRRRILDEGPLSYHLNVASLDTFKVYWLRCNRDMEIEITRRFPFYLVHFLQEGISRYSGPGMAAVSTPGQAVILSPSPSLIIRHTAVTAFSLSLPESLLRESLGRILGLVPQEDLVFQPRIDLGTPVGRSLKGLFDFIIHDLDQPESHLKDSPSFQVAMAGSLADLLITGLRHNYSERLEKSHPASGLDRVHRIEAFLQDHLREPLTLDDLAREACVSKRALQKDFRKHRGSSPMTHLRRLRLEAVYRELQNPAAGTSVTNAAHKFGLGSLGRFSGYYREYFGETPSETLARGRKGQAAL